MHSSTLLFHTLAERVTGLLASSAPCLACRLAAELESEVPTQGPGEGQTSEGVQEPVPINGEVLERLRGMEQQVQMALLELKKKDQQLAREKSSMGRFKVRHSDKLAPSCGSAHLLCATPFLVLILVQHCSRQCACQEHEVVCIGWQNG